LEYRLMLVTHVLVGELTVDGKVQVVFVVL
jgi:hypothetical protein